jgi:hypothetical protein
MILAGLDLGKVKDPTALVVALRTDGVYRLTRIEEWFPKEDDLGDVVPVANGCGAEQLAFDAGGKPGKKFMPLYVRSATMPVWPLLATHQRKPAEQPDGKGGLIFVPKADLVRTYIEVLTARRLCYPQSLPLAWKLSEQIRLYRETRDPVYGHTSWSAPPGQHDDVLSAVQIMLWLGENGGRFRPANRGRVNG